MIRSFQDAIEVLMFAMLLSGLASIFAGCSFKIEAGWHGETGVSDTTISKEFVDTKKPVNERRY